MKGRNSGFVLGNPDSPEYAVIYGYGTKGRFGSVNWNAGAENGLVNYSYVPDSDLLSGYTTGTGMKTVYEYEPHRSLKTSVTNSFSPAGSETAVSQYGYLYDSIGRRTSVKNTGTAFAQVAFNKYGYNDRSEVTSSERYSGTEITDISSPVTPENRTYAYDPIGNRKESAAGTQQALIYETNVLNQYTEISQGASPVTAPEYDDDGNILKYKDKICQWNAENRLISVHPQNPVSGDRKITFLYDYMGRRVRKQVFVHNGTDWNPAPENEKLFVHDGWNVVKETTVIGGAPSAKYYVWGLDLSQSLQGAGGIGGLLCSAENGTVLYYFYDGNGNTAQLVNAGDGSIAAHYEYDPFGNTVTSYGAYADANPFRFSTKYFDAETGLYYYGFRYYSPELGRWWSRDPMGENDGINLYLFIKNNSINTSDLLGLKMIQFHITADGKILRHSIELFMLRDVPADTQNMTPHMPHLSPHIIESELTGMPLVIYHKLILQSYLVERKYADPQYGKKIIEIINNNYPKPTDLGVHFWGIGGAVGKMEKTGNTTFVARSVLRYSGPTQNGGYERGTAYSILNGKIVGAAAGAGIFWGMYLGTVEDFEKSEIIGYNLVIATVELYLNNRGSAEGFALSLFSKGIGAGFYASEDTDFLYLDRCRFPMSIISVERIKE